MRGGHGLEGGEERDEVWDCGGGEGDAAGEGEDGGPDGLFAGEVGGFVVCGSVGRVEEGVFGGCEGAGCCGGVEVVGEVGFYG